MEDHRPVQFEDLPAETLSDILSYLPLEQLLAVSLLSRRLRSICSNRLLTPFAPAIRALLDDPFDHDQQRQRRIDDSPTRHPLATARPWYPPSLRTLSVHLHVPRRLFIDVLVRASPEWILDCFEVPRLSDREWKEVFERRFLRGWQRLRRDDETWRGLFMRLLRRLIHRHLGCTHEEAWTRFITLHRNGSVSMNRIYSRTFDPLEIFRELKQQNDLAAQPTQIRLVCQLQDVRILAFGVLHNPQSFHVNSNAHALLHPPLTRSPTIEGAVDDGEAYYRAARERVDRSLGMRPAGRTQSPPPMAQPSSIVSASTEAAPAISPRPSVLVAGPEATPMASSSRRPLLGDRSGSSSKRGRFFDARGASSSSAGAAAGSVNSQTSRTGPITGEEFLALTRSQSLTNDTPPTHEDGLSANSSGASRPLRPRANSSLTSAFSSILRGGVGLHHHPAPAAATPSFTGQALPGSSPSASASAVASTTTGAAVAAATSGTATRVATRDEPFPAPSPTTNAGLATSADSLARFTPRRRTEGRGAMVRGNSGNTRPLPAAETNDRQLSQLPHTISPTTTTTTSTLHLPYPCMRRPQPAPSHRYYPNFTPAPSHRGRFGHDEHGEDDNDHGEHAAAMAASAGLTVYDAILDRPGATGERRGASDLDDGNYDTRGCMRVTQHERLFVRGGVGPGEDVVDAEWVEDEDQEGGGRAKAWVGPMLLIAQLYPATRIPSASAAGIHSNHINGTSHTVDLGPAGMYASLEFDDLDDLAGWLEVKASEGNGAGMRRDGMGF